MFTKAFGITINLTPVSSVFIVERLVLPSKPGTWVAVDGPMKQRHQLPIPSVEVAHCNDDILTTFIIQELVAMIYAAYCYLHSLM